MSEKLPPSISPEKIHQTHQYQYAFWQRCFAEWLGTAALLCGVVGSGIMAQQLSGGNEAIALLGNTLATVCLLFVLIELLGPVSGAHFNPCVTLLTLTKSSLNHLAYIPAQLLGASCGSVVAHAMFGLDVWQVSEKIRNGNGQLLAECLATAGLLLVILQSNARGVHAKTSTLVAGYIGAAYWFTASTSFANPAAVFGRMFSNTFTGIAPSSTLLFVVAQCVGAVVGWALHRCFHVAYKNDNLNQTTTIATTTL